MKLDLRRLWYDIIPCDVIIWSRFFLITRYKASLIIKRDFCFVIVTRYTNYKECIQTVTYGLVSRLSEASFLDRLFLLETFRSNLDLINVAHTLNYQRKLFVWLIKKVLMENVNFLLFPTYVSVTLIKSNLQIHPVNLTKQDFLKFITKVF